MPTFIDQTGFSFSIDRKPERIISTVPSLSEFLWDLGLRNELAGITKFCIHPYEMFQTVQKIGGTKTLNIEKIRSLKPDLIIANKEENERSDIESLQKEFNVWTSDLQTFGDVFSMMKSVGEITEKKKEAEIMIAEIKVGLLSVKDLFNKQKILYFIWNNPYMVAGGNTFIDQVLNYAGFDNLAASIARYPVISETELKNYNPELCLLSSEPYPFKQKQADEISELLPNSKIIFVDGEMFSWYGSRLRKLPAYLIHLKKEIN